MRKAVMTTEPQCDRALEMVLIKGQNLVHHKDDIEHIREILQEALALV